MHDPFVGTWKLNPEKSAFDANHQPRGGTMRWQIEPDGGYLLLAEGIDQRGQPCTEKPQKLFPDGKAYPVENFPGLSSVTSRVGTHTLQAVAQREDGSTAGEGSYTVSADGTSMTAATAGFDSQLRRFEMRTVWDRV